MWRSPLSISTFREDGSLTNSHISRTARSTHPPHAQLFSHRLVKMTTSNLTRHCFEPRVFGFPHKHSSRLVWATDLPAEPLCLNLEQSTEAIVYILFPKSTTVLHLRVKHPENVFTDLPMCKSTSVVAAQREEHDFFKCF